MELKKKKCTGQNRFELKKNIFNKDEYIIADIINHICLCISKPIIYTLTSSYDKLKGIYPGIQVVEVGNISTVPNDSICYLEVESEMECEKIIESGKHRRNDIDYVIYCKEFNGKPRYEKDEEYHCLEVVSSLNGGVILIGNLFSFHSWIIPDDFRVLAIIHCFNESDVIEDTINYLLGQDVDLYLIDNWSDDRTYEIIENYIERYPDKIRCERFPAAGKNDFFDWFHQLERTEQIAGSEEYSWFMHYDADEIHVSPWKNTTLREAIYQIDRLGYNTIDNTVVDFKLTDENRESNIFSQDTYFDYGHRSAHFVQRKTWKKSDAVELKLSGGHCAQIPQNRTFPLNILNKHYPLRSIEQAERKIFKDRKQRFKKEQQERGWHGQYNDIKNKSEILNNSEKLLLWDEYSYDKYYIPSFLTCGIRREVRQGIEQLDIVAGKKIVIYGAGNMGLEVFIYLYRKCNVISWIDKNNELIGSRFFMQIDSIESILTKDFDICLIANGKREVQKIIKDMLFHYGVSNEKIVLFP